VKKEKLLKKLFLGFYHVFYISIILAFTFAVLKNFIFVWILGITAGITGMSVLLMLLFEEQLMGMNVKKKKRTLKEGENK